MTSTVVLCDHYGCANIVDAAEYCDDHIGKSHDMPKAKPKKLVVEADGIYRIKNKQGRWRAIAPAQPCSHDDDVCWEFKSTSKIEKIPTRFFVASWATRRYE